MVVSTLSGDVAPKPMDADSVRQHNGQAPHGELHRGSNNEQITPSGNHCPIGETNPTTTDWSTLCSTQSKEYKQDVAVHTKRLGCGGPGTSPTSDTSSPIEFLRHHAQRYASTRLVFTTTYGEQPDHKPTPTPPRPWKTGALRLDPLSGLFSMLVAIASIIVSLGILVGSDGAPISNWTLAPPSTYLAICTAIANCRSEAQRSAP